MARVKQQAFARGGSLLMRLPCLATRAYHAKPQALGGKMRLINAVFTRNALRADG